MLVCDVTVMQHRHHGDIGETSTTLPRPRVGAAALHPRVGQDRAQWVEEMATDKNFCPTRKTISMEPSSMETSNVSVQNKSIDLAVSASPQICDKRAAHDAALGAIKEENMKSVHLNFSEESSGKANDLSPQSFLKKLWEIVGSNRFQSLWWGDNGNCIVIVEKLFKMELLTRRGPLQPFEIDSMKTFIRQLHLYGFCKMQWDLTRSSSCDEFLADKGAVSAFSKVR